MKSEENYFIILGNQNLYSLPIWSIKNIIHSLVAWQLRLYHCHGCGSSQCCVVGSIPGLGSFSCHKYSQKKKLQSFNFARLNKMNLNIFLCIIDFIFIIFSTLQRKLYNWCIAYVDQAFTTSKEKIMISILRLCCIS